MKRRRLTTRSPFEVGHNSQLRGMVPETGRHMTPSDRIKFFWYLNAARAFKRQGWRRELVLECLRLARLVRDGVSHG